MLLVEDDDDSRKLLGTMLKRYGAKVTSTKSAAEALDVFRSELPDVLISDIGMPDEDGYELIRKLRALRPDQGGMTPAIALTGYASRKDRERALAAGYHKHMAKPIEQAEMIAAIASLCWAVMIEAGLIPASGETMKQGIFLKFITFPLAVKKEFTNSFC